MDIRPSPIAGTWHPNDPRILARTVDQFYADATLLVLEGKPLAVISPHAGLPFSGAVEAHSFSVLHHVYTGNVLDAKGQSTYCGQCGERIIERNWHEIGEWNLGAGGRCGFCNAKLVGDFDSEPGCWGRRRERVSLKE